MDARRRWWGGLFGLAVVGASGVASAGGNRPPTVPVLNNPSEWMDATTTTPVFSWAPSTDPDGDAVTYDVELRDEHGAILATNVGVTGTVTAFLNDLDNCATYAWRTRAVDAAGFASDYAWPNPFRVRAPDGCCFDQACDALPDTDGGGCAAAGDGAAAPMVVLVLVAALGLIRRRVRARR